MKHAARTRLVEARKERLWSQRDLADFLETTQNNISRWERGITTPGPYFRSKLCELFGKKPQELDLLTETNAVETQPNPTPDSSSLPPEQPLPLWHVPYMRNPFFTGRENVLDRLHSALKHEHSALLSQSYALSGLGGIGKTQTAIEYAHRYADEYAALFWINAETTENILSSFVAIAHVLKLPEKEEREQERVAAAVIRWLNAHNRWLLIFDNVEEMELVQGFLPTARTGSLLFTSRKQALGITAQTLDLEKMTPEEGTRFLLYRARLLDPTDSHKQLAPTDEAAVQEIVSLMDGLPLALDQAGAYIEATRCSLSDYLQLLQSFPQRLLDERTDHANHPFSVSKTFTLAFERLEQSNALAAELLTVCAFLAPEAIPEEFFTEGAAQLGPTFEALATDPLQFHAALKTLLTYSLLQRDATTHTLTVHRLVQAVLKARLDEAAQQMWAGRVIGAMNQLFPSTDTAAISYWEISARLLPHALACVHFGKQGNIPISEEYIGLMNKVAFYLVQCSWFIEAEQLYQQSLSLGERFLGSEHLLIASIVHGLAEIAYYRGQYEQAKIFLQRTLSIREHVLGSEHFRTGDVLNNLALVYCDLGKYAQAELFHRRALQIRESTLGTEDPRIANSLNNLGKLSREQGKYRQAGEFLRRALHMYEQMLGPDNPEIISSLENLAMVYTEQGKLADAEALYLRALSIIEQTLGSEHHSLTHLLPALATLYRKQEKYEQAEMLFQRALSIGENVQGAESLQMAEIFSNLAILYLEQEKYDLAESLYQRALIPLEQEKGEHPLLAEPLQGLAQVYTEQGKYEQAGPLYQRALVLRRQNLGPEHPSVAETLHHLARFHQLQQQEVEALSLYQQALVLLEQTFGLLHPKTVKTRAAYEALSREMGCVEGAQAAISSMPGTLEKEPL